MNLSSWALRKATLKDREIAKQAFDNSVGKIVFSNRESLRQWMKDKGWKRSWFFLEGSFTESLFGNDENFKLALSDEVVEIFIPKDAFQITDKQLKNIDRDYEAKSWSAVVEELRDIRRAVEAGVVIQVEDKKLKTWNEFYNWAHRRYHMLEDGADKWIGDDG